MKLRSILTTGVVIAATLWFSKADEQKVNATQVVVSAHEHIAYGKEAVADLTDMPVSELANRFNSLADMVDQLKESINHAEAQTEDFATMTMVESNFIRGVMHMQIAYLTDYISQMTAEMQRRYS